MTCGSAGRRAGPIRTGLVAVVALLLLVGCTRDGEDPAPDPGGRKASIRVASFDFSESQLLAEVYAAALERRGFRVTRVTALGPREVVQPALVRGLVDVVPEYAGSILRFLTAADGPAPVPAGRNLADQLRAALAGRGLVPLRLATAQDSNGFAVTSAFAAKHRLRRLSDLVPLAAGLDFGGPPECPQRPYCLPGLRARYGLAFKSFVPMPTRAATAEALAAGEISVGMLETTDGRLRRSGLVLLADDRRLQPPENVVPVLRREMLSRYGPRLAATLDAVSARLSTAALVELNRQVELQGRPASRAAADWVGRHLS